MRDTVFVFVVSSFTLKISNMTVSVFLCSREAVTIQYMLDLQIATKCLFVWHIVHSVNKWMSR